MFGRRRFLSFPLVIGAVICSGNRDKLRTLDPQRPRNAGVLCTRIGVVSGKAIFGPPLEEYWRKKLQEEAAAKTIEESSTPNSTSN